jgi:hypothetical protein
MEPGENLYVTLPANEHCASPMRDNVCDNKDILQSAIIGPNVSQQLPAGESANEAWKADRIIRERAHELYRRFPTRTALQNWIAAESEYYDPIPSSELREIEKSIRGFIENENILTNNRIQWFLTINGFLITSVALYTGAFPKAWFTIFVSLAGLVIAYSFWISIQLGNGAAERLSLLWKAYRSKAEPGYHEIGVLGATASSWVIQWRLLPWVSLPWIFGFLWSVSIGVSIYFAIHPQLEKTGPAGTFELHLVEEPKIKASRIRAGRTTTPVSPERRRYILLDTRTGRRSLIFIP